MMAEDKLKVARVVSLVASIAVALSSGTNYVYSAYAPQLAERLHLSATESNWIVRMYLSGIPAGMLVDSRGPRLSIMIGAASLFCGYYPIYRAYLAGKDSIGVVALCFFSSITGMGSCCAFNAAMKAGICIEFPQPSRYCNSPSTIGVRSQCILLFNTFLDAFPWKYCQFPSSPCHCNQFDCLHLIFLPSRCPVPNAYAAIPPVENSRDHSNKLHRSKPGETTRNRPHIEPGMNYTTIAGTSSRVVPVSEEPLTETSSILSSSSSENNGEEDPESCTAHHVDGAHHGHHVDIRGWALTRKIEFWLLFSMLGLLTEIQVQALWAKYAPETSPHYIQQRQAIHVSILSVCSFTGRIIAGVSSDVLHRNYQAQRIWLITASGSLFCLAQLCALVVENPHWLFLVSGLSGLAYGTLFGVYPTIVSEVFGLHGLSQNWGTMTISAVISGQIFNLFYGRIYDSHSIIIPGKPRECSEGIECYRDSYYITLLSSMLGLGLSLWTIKRNRKLARELVAALA
ncbi:hypothetical protein BDZ91DRAFT_744170 [Kalaharituber pfeilii]|nr:hypothetical protein BDZ91DRAFT_744170 [Kalaharituber pfeilii]